MQIEVVIRRKNMIQIGEEKIRRGIVAVLATRGIAIDPANVGVRLEENQNANRVEVIQKERIGGRGLFDGSIHDRNGIRRQVTDAINEGLASRQRSDNFTFVHGWETRATPKPAPRRGHHPSNNQHAAAHGR